MIEETERTRLQEEKEKLYELYKKDLIQYQKFMENTKSIEEKVKIIKEVYTFAKGKASEFYSEKYDEFYWFNMLVRFIPKCESSLNNESLKDITPNFYYKKEYKTIPIGEEEELLNYIVFQVRKTLLDELNQQCGIKSLTDDLQGYCLYASAKVIKKCKELNVNARLMKIYPGFTFDETFHKKRGVHYFVLVLIHEKVFLIDITYSQFFLLKRCLLERIGIPLLASCRTGVFMTMDENRRKVAEKLLKDGWILLKDNVLKYYLDGFALSYRNGLYYEKTNDFSYTVPYTILQYYDFLMGKDNQLNHEDALVLGKQKRPLQNPYLDFSKRI